MPRDRGAASILTLQTQPTLVGVSEMVVQATERMILFETRTAPGFIKEISDRRNNLMTSEHVCTFTTLWFERLSTLKTAKNSRLWDRTLRQRVFGTLNESLCDQSCENIVVCRTNNSRIVSLHDRMLDGSFDESLPVTIVITPQVSPSGKMLLWVLQRRAVRQLLPHPRQVVAN